MKKMLVVVAVVAFAFTACGKKKDAAAPTGGTTEPMGSGSDTTAPTEGTPDGSAAAPADGTAPATP